MKLVVAVVQDEHGQPLAENLIREGISSTKLASTGGFFRSGNATFLIGVAANQTQRVIEIIQTSCCGKKGTSGDGAAGATVFVVDVEKMVKC